MTLRVGVAVDCPAEGLSGIGVYGRELIRGLAAETSCALTVFSGMNWHTMAGTMPEVRMLTLPRWPLPTTVRKSLYFATHQVECDIVHETVQMGFLLPTRTPFRKVVTVFDIAPLRLPRLYAPHKALLYRAAMRRSLLRADAVLTDSAHCRDDIRAAYGFDSTFMDKFTVTPLAADGRFSPGNADPAVVSRYGMDQPTFLFVGMLSPHKNLGRVLEAFAVVRDSQPHARLLVVGKRGWQCAALVRRMQALAPSVQWAGYVPDNDLPHLYRAAIALVFPSLYEGFGLPVLEAQACGCPVITSRGLATEETAGGAAALVDPHATGELSDAMRRVVSDRGWRADLAARGQANAARYTWAKTVASTLAAYRAVAGRG